MIPGVTDPEPGEEFIEPVCEVCGRTMVTQNQWVRADAAEKAELTDEGYVVRARPPRLRDEICRPCNNAEHLKRGTRTEPNRPTTRAGRRAVVGKGRQALRSV